MSPVKTAPLADAADRDAARFELGANILVEAGAGTGKTTLLIDRIAFLLLAGGVDVAQLVALTFTEKAAAEIKFRLAERLNRLSAVLQGQKGNPVSEAFLAELDRRAPAAAELRLARIESALRDLERAQIGTIHSFCSHALRLYPLEAGVDPEFKIDADGAAFEEIFEREWASWLDAQLGEHPPQAGAWREVLNFASLQDLGDLARGLCGARVELARAGRTETAVKRLREAAARAEALGEGRPKARGKIEAFLSWISAACRASADGLSGSAAAKPPKPGKSASWPKGWEGGEEEYRSLVKLAERLDPAADKGFAAAVRLLAPLVQSVRAAYRSRGWIGFDGLLTTARGLLRDHPEVRRELKRRCQAVLIDEFQDTDPLQGELLMFLAEREEDAAEEWRSVRLAQGKLFVVGDVKQSIYRFRGADMRAVEGFTGLIETQGGKRCRLSVNFRSSPALVEAVNGVFEKIMLRKAGLQPEYAAIAARPGSQAGTPPAWLLFGGGDAPLPAEAGRRAEGEWIARWIDEERGSFSYRDCAVVLRTTTDLRAYLDAFRRRGIPYVVEAEKYFYGTQEVSDFLNLLRAIDDPTDQAALVGVLRSPLAGLDDREIYELSRAGRLDYRKAAPGLEEFYARLRGFHARVGREPLADILRALLRDTFLLELSASAYHHQQTVSNLFKFSRMADEASDRGVTLKEFIADISRAKRDFKDEGESPLADEDFDAVRVLTIHKAKGLEYPVVFLANLSGVPKRTPSEDAVKVDWDGGSAGFRLPSGGVGAVRALMDIDEAVREEAEAVRVFYVAMTRAKDRLFLLGNADFSSGTFSELLERSGSLTAERVSPPREEGPQKAAAPRPPQVPGAPAALAEAHAAREVLRKEAQAAELFLRPAASERSGAKADLSSAEDEAPVWDDGDSGSFSPAALGGETPPSSGGALFGRLAHQVLERWDFRAERSLSGVGLEALIQERAALLASEEGVADAAAVSALAGDALSVLKDFFASPAAKELAQAEIVGREIPVLYAEGAQIVRGVIDLLYRKDGRLVVADYKTDRLGKADRAGREKLYAEQGRRYSRAVAKALGVPEPAFKVIFLRHP